VDRIFFFFIKLRVAIFVKKNVKDFEKKSTYHRLSIIKDGRFWWILGGIKRCFEKKIFKKIWKMIEDAIFEIVKKNIFFFT
jgi:hypothetical protein